MTMKNRSVGWRYLLEVTEDWVRNGQNWPINIAKREKEQKQKKEEEKHEDKERREKSDQIERDSSDKDGEENEGGEKQSHEATLIQTLLHEKEHIESLKQNDGKGNSPQTGNQTEISIDEADQFTPDNWLPRSSDLIRLTGKHPLNAEPNLSHLFQAGLITPNQLHYVRNHGPVPRLLWELHKINIHHGKLILSMDDLKNNFDTINIPIAL